MEKAIKWRRYHRKPGETDEAWMMRRIEEKIEHDPFGGCWLWSGSNCRGYGKLFHQGRTQLVHRLMCKPSPAVNELAMHKCDVPACCNPNHIFPGTHAANMADKAAKGRTRKTGNGKHSSAADRAETRRLLANGHSVRSVAKILGRNRASIQFWRNKDIEAANAPCRQEGS